MKRLLPRTAQRTLQRIGQTLDPFFAGRWYWSLKRWLAERQLDYVLERHGDRSMQARQATEQYRRAEFAVRYWRSAPGPVMQVAAKALGAGIPVDAVRLVVLNIDLRVRDGQVHLRRPFIMTILNTIFATIVGVHMFLMCATTVSLTGPIWLKAVVILAVAFVYCFLYYGWSLYASRPQHVLAQYGQTLEALCATSRKQPRDNVRRLASQ